GAVEAVPGQADLAERHEARVVDRHLALDHRKVVVGQLRALGMEAERRPHRLAIGRGHLDRAAIRVGIAPDRHDAPDVMLGGARHRAARVLEGGVVQVTVTVDDHPELSPYEPATTMRPISKVGAAVRSRNTRSLPTPSTRFHISSRLPATVISSTG